MDAELQTQEMELEKKEEAAAKFGWSQRRRGIS